MKATIHTIRTMIHWMRNDISYDPMTADYPESIGYWLDDLDSQKKRFMKLSPDEKFFEFSVRLLAVQSSERVWWGKIRDILYGFKSSDRIPGYDNLLPLIKSTGYRFPVRGTRVILDAKYIYENVIKHDWSKYFRQAIDRVDDGFLDGPFLSIKGVGRKTRDLALTDFTLEYPVVDIHVKRTINRFGLFQSSDPIGNVTHNEYSKIRDICLDLSRRLYMFPAKLDRALWHLGRTFCGKTPNCRKCPLNSICPQESVGDNFI